MCLLRAYGSEFDVDAFLGRSALLVDAVYRKGQRCFPDSPTFRKEFEESGLQICVSDRDGEDLAGQIDDAVAFLEGHAGQLEMLKGSPGLERSYLDFLYYKQMDALTVMVKSEYLPPKLLSLAGNLGIGIELSLCPMPEKAEDDESEAASESPASAEDLF